MKSKLIHNGDEKTYALIFETGDEALSEIQKFAKEYRLGASRLSGIGAFSSVRLGFFDWRTKDYRPISLDEQVEVLSFVGDIALENDEPKVHVHLVVGKADGSAWGGHLMEGHVRPTLEIMVIESPRHLRRRLDPESGLPLIQLDAT
jgi:uncharacterized protein